MTTLTFDRTNKERWSLLLQHAVTEPGLMLKAYSAFHGPLTRKKTGFAMRGKQRYW